MIRGRQNNAAHAAFQAAHILLASEGGSHELGNGLLLRADIRHLFDEGYVTITPDDRGRNSGRSHGDR